MPSILLLALNLLLAADGLRRWITWGPALRHAFPQTYGLVTLALCLATALSSWALLDRAACAFRGRPRTGGATLTRMFFCALVLAALCYLTLLQPYREVVIRATLGVAAGACAVYGLLVAHLGTRPWTRRLLPLDLLLTSACITLVAVEGGLRVYAYSSDSHLLIGQHAAARDRLASSRGTPREPCVTDSP